MTTILTKFTNSTARRPEGKWARQYYGEPKSHMKSFDQTLEMLEPRPDDIHLEIGCGGGYFFGHDSTAGGPGGGPGPQSGYGGDGPPGQPPGRGRRAGRDRPGRTQRTCPGRTTPSPVRPTPQCGFSWSNPARCWPSCTGCSNPADAWSSPPSAAHGSTRLVWAIYSLRLYTNRQMEQMLQENGFCDIRVITKGFVGQIATARKPADQI